MSTQPLIHGAGTPESLWRSWRRPFAPFDLTGCARLIVVAPHPDDEVLGVGGLMAIAAAAGVIVDVLAVTDGEASHPGSPTMTPRDLAAARPAETRAALADLGITVRPRRLRVPDGHVGEHEAKVSAAVATMIGAGHRSASLDSPTASGPDVRATWVVTTWRGDGHPDHEATGRAVAAACAVTGARLVEHPVWTWHWAAPGDPRVPWARARTLALPKAVQLIKRDAIARFTTQIGPLSPDPADATVLPTGVLARLMRPHETLFV